MVNWVDADGNDLSDGADQDFKAGMFFSFAGDDLTSLTARRRLLWRLLLPTFRVWPIWHSLALMLG